MPKSLHNELREQGYEVVDIIEKDEQFHGCQRKVDCFVPGSYPKTAKALSELALLTYSGAYTSSIQILDAELALRGESKPEFIPAVPSNLVYAIPNEENPRMKGYRKSTKITPETYQTLSIRGNNNTSIRLNSKPGED